PEWPHLLPGVRRDVREEGTLIVNTWIARFFPLEVFHLLGYRKRRWRGPYLLVSPRREGIEIPRSCPGGMAPCLPCGRDRVLHLRCADRVYVPVIRPRPTCWCSDASYRRLIVKGTDAGFSLCAPSFTSAVDAFAPSMLRSKVIFVLDGLGR